MKGVLIMSGLLKINGVLVKTPKKFGVGIQTIDADSSGRNAAGMMCRDIIASKVKLELEWPPMSDFEAAQILSKIRGAFFSVEYPDPETTRQETKIFYCGDRSLDSYSWNGLFEKIKWQGLSTNFIEK